MKIERISDPNVRYNATKRILSALPEWFGIPDALEEYAENCKNPEMRWFCATENDEMIGFMALLPRYSTTDELHVTGVLPSFHRRGVGSALLSACEEDARSRGVKIITVETLDESSGDENYAKTRNFYITRGFLPLMCVKEIWGEDNPCLILAKPL